MSIIAVGRNYTHLLYLMHAPLEYYRAFQFLKLHYIKDFFQPKSHSPMFVVETYSEAVKILKGEYTIRAIDEHKMDRALIFCRTKIDCDNLEKYLHQRGGSKTFALPFRIFYLNLFI